MLVHVTRFISVQRVIQALIADELKDLVNRLRYGDGTSTKQVLNELEGAVGRRLCSNDAGRPCEVG